MPLQKLPIKLYNTHTYNQHGGSKSQSTTDLSKKCCIYLFPWNQLHFNLLPAFYKIQIHSQRIRTPTTPTHKPFSPLSGAMILHKIPGTQEHPPSVSHQSRLVTTKIAIVPVDKAVNPTSLPYFGARVYLIRLITSF